MISALSVRKDDDLRIRGVAGIGPLLDVHGVMTQSDQVPHQRVRQLRINDELHVAVRERSGDERADLRAARNVRRELKGG